MNTNNISRFLYESALYLDLDPAPVFRALGAEVDPETETESDSDADAVETDNDGVCRPFYKRPHPNLLPEGEGLPGLRASSHLPAGEGLAALRDSELSLTGEGLSGFLTSDSLPEGSLRSGCLQLCA